MCDIRFKIPVINEQKYQKDELNGKIIFIEHLYIY